MSDNLRCYRAIRHALTQCYLGEPSGQMARHLSTLARGPQLLHIRAVKGFPRLHPHGHAGPNASCEFHL